MGGPRQFGPQAYPSGAGGRPGLGGYRGGFGRPGQRGWGRYRNGLSDPSLYDSDAGDGGDPGAQPTRRRRSFVVNWNDPMPLDQALNHRGAGVFILEQAGAGVAPDPGGFAAPAPTDAGMPDADMSAGVEDSPDAGEPPPEAEPPPDEPAPEQEFADGDWQPTNVGYATEGLGERLGHLMEDIGAPDSSQYRVRLGRCTIRHSSDRLVLRALAHRIAGRLGVGTGASPQERRVLSGVRLWHRGNAPAYAGGSNGQAPSSGAARYRRHGGFGSRRARLRSRSPGRAHF